ncbi:unnamed protein product [Gongylonema pulchrum]|uniref:Uncharacterized protein n=1 Tax=Gongylonema pulchrum TaxID=637853 RepID=A0A3P6TN10_9BILA|nr:unnamed protein product [Gongylonema pulchrum]
MMCRFTVSQAHLFDPRPSSAQQAPQAIESIDVEHFFRNGSTLSAKSIEQSAERVLCPVETVAPEPTVENEQVELQEDCTPKPLLEQAVIDNYLQNYKHKVTLF